MTTEVQDAQEPIGTGRPDRRRPRSIYQNGAEPDPRFTLANERTFLAWVRTALAFLAGGVALEALGLGLHPGLRTAASLLLISASVLAAVQGWVGWASTERHLRLARPLRPALSAAPMVAVAIAAAVLVVLAVILR